MGDEMMPARVRSTAVALVMGALVAATTAATAEPRPAATTGAGGTPFDAGTPAPASVGTASAARSVAQDAGRDIAARTAAARGTGGHFRGPALAGEANVGAFLNRFEGEWRGGGMVIADAGDPPRRVSCTATGTTGPTSVDIAGDCRTLAIFRRAIGANLVHEGDRFTGTYIGSRIGDARLVGGIERDTLVMTMEWPKEVNGDTTAQMRITNPGDGTLTIEVIDEIDGDGETFVSTELVFEKVDTL